MPTITTPGGDTVEVITRDQIAEVTGLGHNGLGQALTWSPDRRAIVTALWNHGPYVDPKGKATAALVEDAARYIDGDLSPNVTTIIKSPVFVLCVDREVQPPAKKTYGIRLTAIPEPWVEHVQANGHALRPVAVVGGDVVEAPTEVPREERRPGTVRTEEAPVEDGAPSFDLVGTEVANAVATALLTQVAQIIATGIGDSPQLSTLTDQVANLEERLAGQIAYVDGLRRQLREASDQIVALGQERDGLRTRVRTAEYNLRVATSADTQAVIDAEVHRQVDRLMRQAPGRGHEKDAPARR